MPAKEPCISAKEPYMPAKEPYISAPHVDRALLRRRKF